MERNLCEDLFWNKRNPADLEWRSRKQQGGHEVGRCAQGVGAPPTSWLPCWLLDVGSKSPDLVRSKNHVPEGFIPFGLCLIFFFYETLK